MTEPEAVGPSLATYLETRFNLMTVAINEKLLAMDEAAKAAALCVREAAHAAKLLSEAAQIANDLRYQQRFEAQSDALSAAFASQQQAMQTAFTVAEKAVQAALAAADRAVSKAELASDKRFEALNELRSMLTDMVGNLITKPEAQQQWAAIVDKIAANVKRIDGIEARLNTTAGEHTGEAGSRSDTRANVALAISFIMALLGIAAFMLSRMR